MTLSSNIFTKTFLLFSNRIKKCRFVIKKSKRKVESKFNKHFFLFKTRLNIEECFQKYDLCGSSLGLDRCLVSLFWLILQWLFNFLTVYKTCS